MRETNRSPPFRCVIYLVTGAILTIGLYFILYTLNILVTEKSELYREYDQLDLGHVPKTSNFYSIWEVFCVENYAIMHAIGPGETSYVLLISNVTPRQNHRNLMPTGRVLLRSSGTIKATSADGRLHVSVRKSGIMQSVEDELAGEGIIVEKE